MDVTMDRSIGVCSTIFASVAALLATTTIARAPLSSS